MDDLYTFITYFLIPCFIGGLLGYWAKVKLTSRVEEAERALDFLHSIRVLETYTEKDIIYLFDKVDNEFICQGFSIPEIVEKAKDYKKIMLAIIIHNGTNVIVNDGQIKKVLEAAGVIES